MKKLYDGVIEGKYSSDEDALEGLYETKEFLQSFQKLKYRLKQRLINTIFFIDVNKPSFDETQKAFYSSQKLATAVDILLGRGARKTAIAIAERTLRITLKFEFTDISLNLLKRLTRHFGVMEKNRKKFSKYSLLLDEHLNIFQAETLAEQYLSLIHI